MQGDYVEVSRDVEAVQVPYGNAVTLPKLSRVTIQQVLGDTFTVITDHGLMLRIEGKDADALGQENPRLKLGKDDAAVADEPRIWAELKTCFDPEIPINIVDLGLVYELHLAPGDAGNDVQLKMTLTAPGCGMGPVLTADVTRKLKALRGVGEVTVDLVFEPPWSPEKMSEAARLETGMM